MDEPHNINYILSRTKCDNLDFATKIKDISKQHIESFNYIYEEGLSKICEFMSPLEIIKKAIKKQEGKETFLPFERMKI